MPTLVNEKIRLQAEVQAAAAEITALTAQLAIQQQAVTAAQARLNTARARVTDAQAQIPPLQASVAASNQRLVTINQQIDEHQANEPDQLIELPHPRPNPAWRVWRKRFDELTRQRDQAQANLAAAQVRLNGGQVAVAQAQAGVQAAEQQASAATAVVQATQAGLAAAHGRQAAAQQQIADLDRWNTEIARDPLARAALEQVAAELSARTAVLDEAFTLARFQNEEAEQHLAALVARRDLLVSMLNGPNGVNAHLPAAQAELQAAQAATTAAARRVANLLQRGPR